MDVYSVRLGGELNSPPWLWEFFHVRFSVVILPFGFLFNERKILLSNGDRVKDYR